MAYGGGIFLPSETAYADPNRFKDVLQAEGNKEAAYLSSMDQFYAELDEMTRQFDVTSEMKERFFEEEMAFNRDKLDWQSEESALDRDLERWSVGEQTSTQRFVANTQAGSSRYATDAQSRNSEMGYATDLAKLGLAADAQSETKSMNQFVRGLYNSEESRRQTVFDTAITRVGGKTEPSAGVVGTENSYYNPFNPEQSLSDFADW